MTVLARADGIAKRFGGIQALTTSASRSTAATIYGLIGPNGAGKTTLFNLLTGIYRARRGRFAFDGEPLAGLKPHQVAERGIARTFQNIRLFANLSALENVMIGRHVRTRTGVDRRDPARSATRARRSGDRAACRELLDYVGHRDARRTTRRGACPTAISGVSRSPGHSPPIRSCLRSTSPRPA